MTKDEAELLKQFVESMDARMEAIEQRAMAVELAAAALIASHPHPERLEAELSAMRKALAKQGPSNARTAEQVQLHLEHIVQVAQAGDPEDGDPT